MTTGILKTILALTMLACVTPAWAADGVTHEELAAILKERDAAQEQATKALLSEQNRSFCAACAARNKAMIDALDKCINSKQVLRTCMVGLRDAMKKVNP